VRRRAVCQAISIGIHERRQTNRGSHMDHDHLVQLPRGIHDACQWLLSCTCLHVLHSPGTWDSSVCAHTSVINTGDVYCMEMLSRPSPSKVFCSGAGRRPARHSRPVDANLHSERKYWFCWVRGLCIRSVRLYVHHTASPLQLGAPAARAAAYPRRAPRTHRSRYACCSVVSRLLVGQGVPKSR